MSDFAFHFEGGKAEWEDLRVVRFELTDAMSAPYELRILLVGSPDGELDPFDLVGQRATLRIATGSTPAIRCVHGLVTEAEDKGLSQYGALYEVVLRPPFARAACRTRSRIFLEKSLKQIIEAVLGTGDRMQPGDPKPEGPEGLTDPFAAPEEKFAWRLLDTTRVEDPKARPYVVQYQESDFAFVTRLLEDEGIAYHFEHTDNAVILVMSDHDDGRKKLEPFDALSPGEGGRHLDKMRFGGKLRPTKVRLVDYNWEKPKLAMATEAKGEGDELYVESYPGGFVGSPELGAPLAKARLERLATEARPATAAGSCRLLGAGTIFAFEHPVARFAGEYLVTRARIRGHAEGVLGAAEALEGALPGGVPMLTEVELVRRGASDKPEDSRFRPSLSTPRPRIVGPQTAMVVAEPSNKDAEIHVGGPEGNENGCVRLQFHWDTETQRLEKEPASCWVRVSQVFAGAGGGAVFHPRVGTEVIVEFEEGDPDRPLVTGRVYNGVQPAAANGKGAATVSTLKSLASPGGKVFNEFQFDDTAGEEQVNLTAGKDWNSNVGNNRTETIQNDSKSSVLANRNEDTSADRTTSVGGNNSETVSGDESITVGGSQTIGIGASQSVSIGSSQTIGVGADRGLSVGGSQTTSVAGSNSVAVSGSETYTVGAAQDVAIGATKTENVGAVYSLSVGGPMTETVGGPHTLTTPLDTTNATAHMVNSSVTTINAASTATINTATFEALASGSATLQGATIDISAGGDITISGGSVKIKAGSIELEGGSIKIAGGSTDITGGVVKVN